MSFHKLFYPLAGVLCGLCLLIERADAENPNPNVSGQSRLLNVSIVNEAEPDFRPVTRAYISAGTNKLALVAPDGFKINASNPEKIVLNSTDYSYFLTFHVLSFNELQFSYRDLLLSRYPGAKIQQESSATAAGNVGSAFDLQWKNSGGQMQSARVAFIPSALGILEFSVVATSDKFTEAQYSLNSLLLTFRSNQKGKLEVIQFPSAS